MYERNGTLYRDLFKAYGIRFLIKVSGKQLFSIRVEVTFRCKTE